MRILVVDDNVGSAQILSRLLAKLGDHQVWTAYDGPTTLETAKACHPELVLLDIGLPHISGYEVAQKLREQPESNSALLVAVTGYGTEDDVRRAREAGFDRHLTKPASVDDLRQLLADPMLSWG
jgi:CheY-like chemotaxis protein